MGAEKDDFLKRLRGMFKVEAAEHLKAVSADLLELEKGPDAERKSEIVETAFREVHSLKGAARSVDVVDIETTCQTMETLLSNVKRGEMELSPELFDMLHQTIDAMSDLVDFVEKDSPIAARQTVAELTRRLSQAIAGEHAGRQEPAEHLTGKDIARSLPEELDPETSAPVSPEEESPVSPASDGLDAAPTAPHFVETKDVLTETVRIPVKRLDSLLFKTEELLSLKLTAAQRVADIRELSGMLGLWKKEWAKIYPDLRRIGRSFEKDDRGMEPVKGDPQSSQLSEFLDWDHDHMKSFESKLDHLERSAEQAGRSTDAMVKSLLQDMKEALLLPFSVTLDILPRFVRNLSRDQGKEIELVIRGSDNEIDRRILEEMKDPLIHLVRNSIDHGIEKPEERAQKKKPRTGKITVAVSHIKSYQVEILVSDDGKGIDPEKVKEAAIKRGVISEEEATALTEQEALSLIFQSDVSTSPIITDISGRGLGLAIVRDKVEKLGGLLSLHSSPHEGSFFKIILPSTLTSLRGVLVRTADQVVIAPTSNVERTVRVRRDTIKTVENRQTIQLNGHTLLLVKLHDILELTQTRQNGNAPEFIPVMVLGSGEKRIAFSVDEVLNEQEFLFKSLGKQLSRVRNIAGATVLGSGKVVPILNISDLMQSVSKESTAARRTTLDTEEPAEKNKAVLVVEDSITSRILLKSILESAGYQVKTAVDGVDAFAVLRTEQFDLVVSDVDMPRMNGFGLTSKIRGDKKLADLPVVLVTALESREDREHGVDAGANAYIVKSGFDQSNLLDVIRKLIP